MRSLFAKITDDPRIIAELEAVVDRSETAAVGVAANAEATKALQDASVLTLSGNDALNNERILKLGSGLSGVMDGKYFTITITGVPGAEHDVQFITAGDSVVALPMTGRLATVDQRETLKSKTLVRPKLSGIVEAASDAAAAAAGVVLGEVYYNGTALTYRRA